MKRYFCELFAQDISPSNRRIFFEINKIIIENSKILEDQLRAHALKNHGNKNIKGVLEFESP